MPPDAVELSAVRPARWPVLAAVLVWNAFVLVFFLEHFWIGPSRLANAAVQYLVWPSFHAATLAANWAPYSSRPRSGSPGSRLWPVGPEPPRAVCSGSPPTR